MRQEILYQYLGTNGTILSPVHLENIYSVKKIRLFADKGKALTKDGKKTVSSVTVSEDEINDWYEV